MNDTRCDCGHDAAKHVNGKCEVCACASSQAAPAQPGEVAACACPCHQSQPRTSPTIKAMPCFDCVANHYAADPFQSRVQHWCEKCFDTNSDDYKAVRVHRFLEEAIELAQSLGGTKWDVLQLADYVFARPLGDPAQEVGGVMVTLASLCTSRGIDLQTASEAELDRVWKKIDVIRAKQASKPKGSPLPVAQSAEQQRPAEDVLTQVVMAARLPLVEMCWLQAACEGRILVGTAGLSTLTQLMACIAAQAEELAKLRAELVGISRTRDGVVIKPGMELWNCGWGGPPYRVKALTPEHDAHKAPDHDGGTAADCYSTEAAALAGLSAAPGDAK